MCGCNLKSSKTLSSRPVINNWIISSAENTPDIEEKHGMVISITLNIQRRKV